MEVRSQELTRYIVPLREGGSLPVLGEADDGFKYVVKLRYAGHGKKALIAEFLESMIAKAFKFNVPEVVLLDLSNLFGITEPDEEVQELCGTLLPQGCTGTRPPCRGDIPLANRSQKRDSPDLLLAPRHILRNSGDNVPPSA